jgi:hypothetical protein
MVDTNIVSIGAFVIVEWYEGKYEFYTDTSVSYGCDKEVLTFQFNLPRNHEAVSKLWQQFEQRGRISVCKDGICTTGFITKVITEHGWTAFQLLNK